MRRLLLVWCSFVLTSCANNFDPASYVSGLRALAIKVEPPEAAPGQTSLLSELAVATDGSPVHVAWSECDKASLPGQTVSGDCFTTDMANQSYLHEVGSGTAVAFVMPMISANNIGLPDVTGGVYVTLRADTTTARESVIGSYRLRLSGYGTPNHNPQLAGVFRVPPGFDMGLPPDAGAADVVALDAAQPLVVHAGDALTLRATFAAGSAERYTVNGGSVTEVLTIAWFATAGSFSNPITGASSNTVLMLDKHLPAPGTTIDVWIVGRDERGGTDYLHRTLSFQ
jgi:hypothetical protein